jgi:hypothetical protein
MKANIIGIAKVDIILAGNIAINSTDINKMNDVMFEMIYWNRHHNDVDVDLVIDLLDAQIDKLTDAIDVDFLVKLERELEATR